MGKVLIIEPDYEILTPLVEIQVPKSYDVLYAPSWQSGLEQLANNPDAALVSLEHDISNLRFALSLRDDHRYVRFKNLPLLGYGHFSQDSYISGLFAHTVRNIFEGKQIYHWLAQLSTKAA